MKYVADISFAKLVANREINVLRFKGDLIQTSEIQEESLSIRSQIPLNFTNKLRSKLWWSWLTWFQICSSIYENFIYHFTSILHRLIRTHKWPAPNVSGFIAQLVRASHQYREVTGSNPVKSWLLQASVRNCLNCVQNWDDHGLLVMILFITML